MKTQTTFSSNLGCFFGWLSLAFFCGTSEAQQAIAPPGGSIWTDYAITRVGPHSRVWGNSAGQTISVIATGLNYWDGQQWTPSNPSFEVSPDGTAFIASQIQDPTKISAELNTAGAVTVTTPDNVTLSSTPVAIGLYDAASGKSVVVAALTNTTGVLVDPQHVVYLNAFVGGGFAASVVYSLPDTGSFHQDVVFTGFDPGFDPTVWGFAAGSTKTLRIQIFTEFYNNPPQPLMIMRPLYVDPNPADQASMASPDLIDYTLDFGDYVFGPGRAYATTTNYSSNMGVPTAKDFVTDATSGRTYLVESIPFTWLQASLSTLPPVKVSSLNRPANATKMKIAAASLPPLRGAKKSSIQTIAPSKTASLAVSKPKGVVVDYVVTVSSTAKPTVYSSDTTYFVTNNVYESAAVSIESAVFKYPTTNIGGSIALQSTLTLATTNYRPAIFTAADDNTAGSTLGTNVWSGYTGTVGTNGYGSAAVYWDTTANIALSNLRFCYMNCALQIAANSLSQTVSLSHAQLVNCITGINITGQGVGSSSLALNVNNCLMANVQNPFQAQNLTLTGTAWNCTIDNSSNLLKATSSAGSLLFTNSIFSGVVSEGSYAGMTLSGNYNGFSNTWTAFGSHQTTATSNPYVSFAAGNYYLPPTSSLLTNGTTTGMSAALLSQLQVKTVQAPLSLTNAALFSTIIAPVVPRDTAGIALGWHYDPIDFLATPCTINAGCTLTLTNGVALGYDIAKGIKLSDASALTSQGQPNNRNYLVYYNLVQEQPVKIGAPNGDPALSLPFDVTTITNPAAISLRLTTICVPTGEATLLTTGDIGDAVSSLTLRDCEIYGSGATWYGTETNNRPNFQLINNLFYRVPFVISNTATITNVNNVFYGTTNNLTNTFTITIRGFSGTSSNLNENNVFDGTFAGLDGTVGYNAYLNGGDNLYNTPNHDIITNMTWTGGPLGAFYQASNGPLLTNGTGAAGTWGLFHYTVQTNEIAESNNVVSRGYHYVTVTNGLPLDFNNDGVPDYLEDANGDGNVDDGETSWNTSTPAWVGTEPFNQYALSGGSVTFNVAAYGTAPLTYQWYNNGAAVGANSSNYTTTTASGSGPYSVEVSNSGGSATSSNATLTVVQAPAVTNVSPSTNTPYWLQTNIDTLSAWSSVYGSPTPAYYSQYLSPYLQFVDYYQWQLNSANISGASGVGSPATYLVPTNGTYSAVLTNPAGSTTVTWTNLIPAAPGMVECWGDTNSGEANRPLSTNVSSIAAGTYQSIAVTNGAVYQWGQYSDGANFYSVANTTVANPPPASNVVAVAAGMQQGLALMNNGTVYSWGLTNNASTNLATNQYLTGITAVACGYHYDLALTSSNTVIAWGHDTNLTTVPTAATNVTAIAAGGFHSLALLSNGTVIPWGYNTDGEASPTNLTGIVAIAAGLHHSMALSSNGVVTVWGDNSNHQQNVPASVQSNAMAIAAGDNHCLALLNTGTVVAWGLNASNQTNVPLSNPTTPVNVKLIAAGGNHSMVGIWSPQVQYPVNPANDVLLIYNTASSASISVFNYYLANRPGVAAANILGVDCSTNGISNETYSLSSYNSEFVTPVANWLSANPAKRPQYVVLFQDLPTTVAYPPPNTNVTQPWFSVQYDLNCGSNTVISEVDYLLNWHPFVTSINVDPMGSSNNCINYINKLKNVAGTSKTLFISASATGYSNTNWYFDDIDDPPTGGDGAACVAGVSNVNPTASIFTTRGGANFVTKATNVAGYYTCSEDCVTTNCATNAVNGVIQFYGQSTWYVISTTDSYNGLLTNGYNSAQWRYVTWFCSNSFGSPNNYTNTPVGAVVHVQEPGGNPASSTENRSVYFGDWAAGWTFGISAWNSFLDNYLPADRCAAVGDPFVSR